MSQWIKELVTDIYELTDEQTKMFADEIYENTTIRKARIALENLQRLAREVEKALA